MTKPLDSKSLVDAIERGSLEECRAALDNGFDVNALDEYGGKALHLAAYNGWGELCDLLIERGADPNDCTAWGTPLHEAAIWGMENACRALIKHGADPSFVPENALQDYLTPFQAAINQGELDYPVVDVVRMLVLEYGQDIHQRTLAGKTLMELTDKPALQLALRSLETEVAIHQAITPNEDVPTKPRLSSALSPL